MLKLISTICLIILITSSSFSLNDLMSYYSLNIGKIYPNNNNNYIKLINADNFTLIQSKRTGVINLLFKIQVEINSPE
jgi:hypothetical protein